jgi:hypothetical protein
MTHSTPVPPPEPDETAAALANLRPARPVQASTEADTEQAPLAPVRHPRSEMEAALANLRPGSRYTGPRVLTTRPPQVWIVATLLVLYGALNGISGCALLSIINDPAHSTDAIPAWLNLLIVGEVLVCAAEACAGPLIVSGRSWGRYLAITICSFSVFAGLLSLVASQFLTAIVAIGVNGALLALLSSSAVRDWCASGGR